jgi:signal transduction histidine kinase
MAPDENLKKTDQRLTRLSVLQELTVAALDLFDPERSPDPLLERIAERLGCLAVIWLAIGPENLVTLHGAAGLSMGSRELPILTSPREVDPALLALPYPEVARPGMVRWQFRPHQDPSGLSHVLLLWFDAMRTPPEEYRAAVERLAGVLRTVLTHRRLADELRRSYADLARTQLALVERERLAAVGELAATVAHEVRNPLAVMFNCVSTLQKVVTALPDAKELLGTLLEEANRINQIVSELLEFARPADAFLRIDSLEDILTGAIAAVEGAQAEPPKVRVELVIARPLRPMLLDGRLVRRAIINLVGNALQAMPGGGRIVVRVVEESLARRPVVRIEVSDDGPGIPASTLERIFDPFFTTKASGTGLGLSIAKRVVEAHDGQLSVHSEEGRGTTFTIRLPSWREQAPPRPECGRVAFPGI